MLVASHSPEWGRLHVAAVCCIASCLIVVLGGASVSVPVGR